MGNATNLEADERESEYGTDVTQRERMSHDWKLLENCVHSR